MYRHSLTKLDSLSKGQLFTKVYGAEKEQNECVRHNHNKGEPGSNLRLSNDITARSQQTQKETPYVDTTHNNQEASISVHK